MRWLKLLLLSFGLGICCLCSLGMGVFFYLLYTPIDLTLSRSVMVEQPTVLLDDQGTVWARFARNYSEPVQLASLPAHVINAFVAAEDHAFFMHHGLSLRGIIRSLLVNLYYGKRVQGASTITQQLVRMLFFDARKTLRRKVKEQIMALVIECQYTKEQILEAYLNTAYFGAGVYGIAAASKRFWNSAVEQLTLEQAATLAGIVKSPSHYCPLFNPLSAQQRRNTVLHSMHVRGMISTAAYEVARATQMVVVPGEEAHCCAPYLREVIRQWAEHTFGKAVLYTQGFTIQTTLNKDIQIKAERALHDQIEALRHSLHKEVEGALVTIEAQTGAIKAYSGGYDFILSPFNRCRAYRQIGSLFKPLVYAAALEQGYSFADVMSDEPITVTYDKQVWEPGNANDAFEGPMTLAYALAHSNNIVAIKLLLAVGAQQVVALADKCHVPHLHSYPSLALGCVDATLEQAAAMFNVFPNHGYYVHPYCVEWVQDARGQRLWKHTITPEPVMKPCIADRVLRVLCIGMERLGKRMGTWINSQACGKTGTPSESRTCFFVGATPALTTGIMIGCDDNRSLGRRVFAVRTAFPVWYNLHRTITSPQERFAFDPSLKLSSINGLTGAPAAPQDPIRLDIFT